MTEKFSLRKSYEKHEVAYNLFGIAMIFWLGLAIWSWDVQEENSSRFRYHFDRMDSISESLRGAEFSVDELESGVNNLEQRFEKRLEYQQTAMVGLWRSLDPANKHISDALWLKERTMPCSHSLKRFAVFFKNQTIQVEYTDKLLERTISGSADGLKFYRNGERVHETEWCN